MIDSNNQFKKLSQNLIKSVRDVMEVTKEGGTPKTDKQKDLAAKAPPHDKITHADVLVGRGVLKKHPTTGKLVTKEEVEEIDELSRKTLSNYVKKAADDAASKGSEYGTKKAEADEMDRMMNRHMSFSDKDKVRGIMKTTVKDYEKPREKALRRIRGIGKAVNRLAKEETGLDLARTVLNNIRNEVAQEIDELSKDTVRNYYNKAGEQGKKIADKMKMGGGDWTSDGSDTKTLRKRAAGRDMALKRRYGQVKMSEETEIDEALDAAARYGQHHVAIKDLLKSIDQHVRSHKDDALKHVDFRGKKGVNWGHVGDLAQVHSQLADVHDRLAQQGEYKKSMSESADQIDELSKKTLGAYIKKAGGTSLDSVGYHMNQAGYTNDPSFSKKSWNKGIKRARGVEQAADKIVKESEETFTEIKTTQDIIRRVARNADRLADLQKRAGIAGKVDTNSTQRKMKEDLELDEARGRPRKNPLPDAKKGDPDEVEARMHIIQQLERAKLSMRGGEPVSFMDGTKHTVHSPDANKIIVKYHSMKPYEKEIFQKKIHASHAGLKAEL